MTDASDPPPDADRRLGRPRLPARDELLLALLPTGVVLAVLGLVEAVGHQRLLFASLASSAFLIYLDPKSGTNSVRTLVVAQLGAAVLGLAADLALGPGYAAGAVAMTLAIGLMVLADAVHPPAASTALTFAFRSGDASNALLFGLAVGVLAGLVVLQRAALRLLAWRTRG